MLRNFFITALRNFKKNKIFTFINITGFALGLAACLLIILFVYNELSYEKIHGKRDSIYRVALYLQHSESKLPFAAAMPPLAPALESIFPEVENTVRIRQLEEPLVSRDEIEFKEEKFVFYGKFLLRYF